MTLSDRDTDVAESADQRLPPEVRRIGFVVIIGVIMAFLDSTIVNVALNSLSNGLGMPIGVGQWTVTAYLLALAAVATVSTWAARRLGTRRLYLGALVVFTAASALCGLAQTPWQLIAFRAVQGAGAGLIGPAGQLILVQAAGPRRIARALAAFGVPVMLAPVLGPPLGGLIVGFAGWRWIFLVNLPIGIVGALLAWRVLPRTAREPAGRFDVLGFGLIAPGMAALTYGLAELGDHGQLDSAGVLLPLLAGAALIAAFAVRAPRVPHSLLDLRLYRNRRYALASLACFAMGGVIFGATILMPLYFQWVRGEGTVATGLLLAPQGIGIALAMWRSGALYERFGPAVVLAGTAVTLLATLPLAFLGTATPYAFLCVVLAVRGAGIGLANMPAMSEAYRALDPDRAGEATTQLNVLQRLGGSLATAAVVVILHQQVVGDPAAHDAASRAGAFSTAFWAVGAATLLTVLPAVALMAAARRRERAGAGVDG
ncbi:MDR family MFS transporter [Streptomyces inhibens]|uniref:MDR family MFS transporter n=1 Tax=Streptomyces inhibens TaxID=2293571 RepID=UPI00402ADDB1